MKLIVENTDYDTVEAMKRNNPAVREYLKGKENEQDTGGEHPRHDASSSLLQGGAHKARKSGALKSAKPSQDIGPMAQSKTVLARRVAELERKERNDEKKFEQMRNKVEQSNQEREHYKR